MSIELVVERLIREVLPRRMRGAPLEAAMTLSGDLGIDSFGLMSLAFRLEEECEVDLLEHADRVADVRTVGDICALVDAISSRPEAS